MILNADHIVKTYQNFQLDCSLQLREGHITGLIGANGAGKTTAFKALLGLLRPESGSIEILGKDQKKMSVKDKENIGVVLAESTFNSLLTVKDILAVMDAMYQKFDRQVFAGQCERFRIPFDKKLKDFSTGMKAKFKLLIAMSYDADLLILDEPTSGLDAITRTELLDEMRGYMSDEKAILVSSHISSDLEGLCDDLYFIHDGRIQFHEDTDVILSDYGLLKVDEEQYQKLDRQHILYAKKESYGYSLLTNQKQYYCDNYPEAAIEKGSIDAVLVMMENGQHQEGALS